MARYLVVAHLTAGSPEFRAQIRSMVQSDPEAEFTLLVPTSPPTHRLVWDDEEVTQLARARAAAATMVMRETGANVTRTAVGSRDPLSAIEDELRDHARYSAIVICSLPAGISRWLKADLVSRCRQRTSLPVIHTVAREEWTPPGEPTPIARSQGSAPVQVLPDSPPAVYRDPSEAVAGLLETVGALPAVVDAAANLDRALQANGSPDPALLALVVLRVAELRHCAYTWQDAVGVARGLGISDDRIAALDHWQASERVTFTASDRATLKYVDALVRGGDGVHGARETLAAHWSADAIVAITLAAGLARCMADVASAFGLTPAEPFVGWGVHIGRVAVAP